MNEFVLEFVKVIHGSPEDEMNSKCFPVAGEKALVS